MTLHSSLMTLEQIEKHIRSIISHFMNTYLHHNPHHPIWHSSHMYSMKGFDFDQDQRAPGISKIFWALSPWSPHPGRQSIPTI